MANVLFDVNGTLLDPRALTASWEGAPSGLGLSVLDQTVLQSMVDTMTGEFRPFPDYIRAALAHRAALLGLGDDAVEAGMAAAAALPAYPDAADALAPPARRRPHAERGDEQRRRRRAGGPGRGGAARAHARGRGRRRGGAYKPDPRVYRNALDVLGLDPAETWFVAGHWWDVTGAKRAGLRTAWVARDEGVLLPTAPEPDVTRRRPQGAWPRRSRPPSAARRFSPQKPRPGSRCSCRSAR